MSSAGNKCVYFGCGKSRSSESQYRPLKMFRFPREDTRSGEWVINSGNPSLLELSAEQLYQRNICEDHFHITSFMNPKKQRLVFNAIPIPNTQSPHYEILKYLKPPATNTGNPELSADTLINKYNEPNEQPEDFEMKLLKPTATYTRKNALKRKSHNVNFNNPPTSVWLSEFNEKPVFDYIKAENLSDETQSDEGLFKDEIQIDEMILEVDPTEMSITQEIQCDDPMFVVEIYSDEMYNSDAMEQLKPSDKHAMEQLKLSDKHAMEQLKSSDKHAMEQLKTSEKRAMKQLKPSDKHAMEQLKSSDKHAMEQLKPSDKHAMEQLKPSDKHAMEQLKSSDKHAMEQLKTSEKRAMKQLKPSDKHAMEQLKLSDKHAMEQLKSSDKHAMEQQKPSDKHAMEQLKSIEKHAMKQLKPSDKHTMEQLKSSDKHTMEQLKISEVVKKLSEDVQYHKDIAETIITKEKQPATECIMETIKHSAVAIQELIQPIKIASNEEKNLVEQSIIEVSKPSAMVILDVAQPAETIVLKDTQPASVNLDMAGVIAMLSKKNVKETKDKTLTQVRDKLRKAQQRIARQKKRLHIYKELFRPTIDNIMKYFNHCSEHSKILVRMQLKRERQSWLKDECEFAATLFKKSQSVYQYLRDLDVILPAESTVRTWRRSARIQNGFEELCVIDCDQA